MADTNRAQKFEDVKLPFGIRVKDQPDLLISPFIKPPYINVKGFKPGDRVVCPFTRNVFIVPEPLKEGN